MMDESQYYSHDTRPLKLWHLSRRHDDDFLACRDIKSPLTSDQNQGL